MNPETTTIVPVLTATEMAALLECESIIRAGQETFVKVGRALARIRDSKLYRGRYSTFEAYCLAEWDMTDRYARNLWSAADVVGVLEGAKFLTLPATESQARPITRLPREEWPPTWAEVLARSVQPDGQHRVTASRVAEVVQRRLERIERPDEQEPHPVEAEPVIDLPDLSTREQQVRVKAGEALAKLCELRDLIGTADGTAASGVSLAVHQIHDLQDHLTLVEQKQAAKQANLTQPNRKMFA